MQYAWINWTNHIVPLGSEFVSDVMVGFSDAIFLWIWSLIKPKSHRDFISHNVEWKFSESGSQRYIILSEDQFIEKYYFSERRYRANPCMFYGVWVYPPLKYVCIIMLYYSFSPLPFPLKFLDSLTESLLIIRITD